MKTVVFQNPGEIDPRLIATMGCNVKESENPIGFFGTGLKYALAVLMREQQTVKIWSGERPFIISTRSETIRGKEFQMVLMNNEPMGFTTELGKQWTLENAYRELYCNAQDEGGDVREISDAPWAGQTTIEVSGEKFWQVHQARGEFILRFSGRRKLYEMPEVGEIYEGPGDKIFYKGIAVGPAPEGGFYYTFNLSQRLELTEDRSYKSEYSVQSKVCEILAKCTDREIIRKSIDKNRRGEAHLAFHWTTCSDEFYQTAADLIQAFGEEGLVDHARMALYKAKGVPKPKWREVMLTAEELQMLEEAISFWKTVGVNIREYDVKIVASVASTPDVKILAAAHDNRIWLTPECFAPELLKLALFEEWTHLRYRVQDETREMQNVLFKHILQLASSRRIQS